MTNYQKLIVCVMSLLGAVFAPKGLLWVFAGIIVGGLMYSIIYYLNNTKKVKIQVMIYRLNNFFFPWVIVLGAVIAYIMFGVHDPHIQLYLAIVCIGCALAVLDA